MVCDSAAAYARDANDCERGGDCDVWRRAFFWDENAKREVWKSGNGLARRLIHTQLQWPRTPATAVPPRPGSSTSSWFLLVERVSCDANCEQYARCKWLHPKKLSGEINNVTPRLGLHGRTSANAAQHLSPQGGPQ